MERPFLVLCIAIFAVGITAHDVMYGIRYDITLDKTMCHNVTLSGELDNDYCLLYCNMITWCSGVFVGDGKGMLSRCCLYRQNPKITPGSDVLMYRMPCTQGLTGDYCDVCGPGYQAPVCDMCLFGYDDATGCTDCLINQRFDVYTSDGESGHFIMTFGGDDCGQFMSGKLEKGGTYPFMNPQFDRDAGTYSFVTIVGWSQHIGTIGPGNTMSGRMVRVTTGVVPYTYTAWINP